MSDISETKPPHNKVGRPPKVPRVVAAASVEPGAAEIAYWESVRNSKDPEDIELYLEKYPDGFFAELGERRKTQCLLAQVAGGEPDEQPVGKMTASAKRPTVIVPQAPVPEYHPGDQVPHYALLQDFFADDDCLYKADMEIDYLGPPNEHMFPLNDAARYAKREQEEYLDACWAVKCKAEGRPVSPRPKELADQVEAERNALRAQTGVVMAPGLPPSRPDLRKGPAVRNPNASRVGAATAGKSFADRPSLTNAPLLGRDGGRYQRQATQGFGHPLPDPAATV